jgi:transcriptional regulator with XRE-family HTH domain
MPRRTNTPFIRELPRLLKEEGLSTRKFAETLGVSPSHLSRVLRRVDYKTPSLSLMTSAAEALGLSPDYFPDVREDAVISTVKTDSDLRDCVYDRIQNARAKAETRRPSTHDAKARSRGRSTRETNGEGST